MSLAKEWSRSRRTGRRSNKHRPRTGENSTHWTRSDRGRREVGQRSSLDGRKQHDLHTRSCKLRKDVGERSCESERGRSSKEVARHGKRLERGRAKRKEVGEVARHGNRSCESDCLRPKLRTRAVGKFPVRNFLEQSASPKTARLKKTPRSFNRSQLTQIEISGHKIRSR